MDFRTILARFLAKPEPPLTPRATPPNTVSAADVAEAVVTIETCPAMPARFAAPPSAMQNPQLNPFLQWSTSPVQLKMYRFRDVVFDRDHMVLLTGDRVIAETSYLQTEANIAALRVRTAELIRPNVQGAVTTCFDHWEENYYHWMVHAIPVLHAIQLRLPNELPSLVLPPRRPWQGQTLDILGMAGHKMITALAGKQYFFPLVEYYDIVAGTADFAVSPLSQRAYAHMSAQVAAEAPMYRRIYIDRSHVSNRRMANENALVDRLRQRGYTIVRPEDMPVAAQIALFHSAALVVAQIGAGLANIAFCQPGAMVYEIMPSHHQNPCILKMAMQANLNYWCDVFETGAAGGDYTSAWSADIDIPQVLRRLDELEAMLT